MVVFGLGKNLLFKSILGLCVDGTTELAYSIDGWTKEGSREGSNHCIGNWIRPDNTQCYGLVTV